MKIFLNEGQIEQVAEKSSPERGRQQNLGPPHQEVQRFAPLTHPKEA
jgi:hypothetical protein